MTLQEIKKLQTIKESEMIETTIEELMQIKKLLKPYEEKYLREPTKRAILELINNNLTYFKAYINRNENNNIIFYLKEEHTYFYYTDLNHSYCRKNFKIDIDILALEIQTIIKNNNLDLIIDRLKGDFSRYLKALKTYDKDIKKLEENYQKINTLIDEFNNVNYINRIAFNEREYTICKYPLLRDDYLRITRDKRDCYTIEDIDIKKIKEEAKEKSEFLKNNLQDDPIEMSIEFDRKDKNTIVFNFSGDFTIKYNYSKKEITQDIILNYNYFDKFENLSTDKYKKLRFLAKLKFDDFFKRKYNFDDESCFISSNALHGFYFPNIENGNFIIAFKNSEPVIIYNDNIFLR